MINAVEPGVEAGFAARVLHTTIDSFGSLSIVRVVSNDFDSDSGMFSSLPQNVVSLRTGALVKIPSISTCFGLCGKGWNFARRCDRTSQG